MIRRYKRKNNYKKKTNQIRHDKWDNFIYEYGIIIKIIHNFKFVVRLDNKMIFIVGLKKNHRKKWRVMLCYNQRVKIQFSIYDLKRSGMICDIIKKE